MSVWRPMDRAPRPDAGNIFSRPRFLARRYGRIIICWRDDDRHARKPRPYWSGTDAHHNVDFCRKTAPDGWRPLPPLEDTSDPADSLAAALRVFAHESFSSPEEYAEALKAGHVALAEYEAGRVR